MKNEKLKILKNQILNKKLKKIQKKLSLIFT